jgi:hypothetical protein
VIFFLADCVDSICAKQLKIRRNIELEEQEEGGHSHHATFWISEAAPTVDSALHRLEKRGEIRRVIRGIYDYPRFSKLLDQHLSPDIDQVARVLARKFRWRIQPSGATALNFLGLSTQVPARAVYLSDGPDRVYQVGNTALAFEHTALKESGVKLAAAAYNALAADKEKGASLCTNRNGKPLYEMRYWFLRALEASGVKDFTFHDVRHTAASRWVMSGVPLAEVAKYLGHSGGGMVMRYAHLQPEVNAKAINAAMSFYPQAAIQTDTKTKTKSDTN